MDLVEASIEGKVIVLRALGTAEIETPVTTVTPSREIVFATALFLVVERGKRVSRAHLASLLWPRVPEKARAHRLRQTLHQLKKLGITVLADRNILSLNKENVRSDVDRISDKHLASSETIELLEFLPGYVPRFSEGFQDWVDMVRENTYAALTVGLLSALRTARDSGNWVNVERISAQCLRLDAYNEA